MEHVDVVVVGGGPAGMAVAGDLARAGRSVVVLERHAERNPSSRAFVTMARTLELLESRGLAADLVDGGTTITSTTLFAGAAVDFTHLPSPFPFALITPQTRVDAALEGYAVEHGARVERGVEVVALEQDADGVTVTARERDGVVTTVWRAPWVVGADGAHSTVRDLVGEVFPREREGDGGTATAGGGEGGGTTVWRAPWVVGADGAHSTVRDLVGEAFPGRTVLSSMVLADVRATDPPGGGMHIGTTVQGYGLIAPYGDGWFRSMTWDRENHRPDDAEVDDAEIGPVLARSLGRDVGVSEIGWRSRFSCDERQVARYRVGRVLLAGDAAHVHSPVGGQGMNAGIQDAVNLAWKIDAVLGGADDAVLETYQDERHAVGASVIELSGRVMRQITLEPAWGRWLRDRVAPAVLSSRRASVAIAGRFTAITLRYGRGSHDHRLVGTRAVQVPLVDGSVLQRLREPGFLLVRERGATAPSGVPDATLQAERDDDGPALLVRPDGYVAWAGAEVADARDGGWRRALAAWTGAADLVGAVPAA